eukprot:CAMPEP_0173233244 /NCGR_PEP_ID=MMETSP1142-20121109/9487_1 /TAXON_ID=483371 /ORGANISM="non described non described, Strain CCMP2298" /LENGTH=175 /DNA_ID=CAMNT_0014163001 /DNA_START=55 /DNA_END=579 /DNA_ORIENTATION=+
MSDRHYQILATFPASKPSASPPARLKPTTTKGTAASGAGAEAGEYGTRSIGRASATSNGSVKDKHTITFLGDTSLTIWPLQWCPGRRGPFLDSPDTLDNSPETKEFPASPAIPPLTPLPAPSPALRPYLTALAGQPITPAHLEMMSSMGSEAVENAYTLIRGSRYVTPTPYTLHP